MSIEIFDREFLLNNKINKIFVIVNDNMEIDSWVTDLSPSEKESLNHCYIDVPDEDLFFKYIPQSNDYGVKYYKVNENNKAYFDSKKYIELPQTFSMDNEQKKLCVTQEEYLALLDAVTMEEVVEEEVFEENAIDLKLVRNHSLLPAFDIWEKNVIRGRENDSEEVMTWYYKILDMEENSINNPPKEILYYLNTEFGGAS